MLCPKCGKTVADTAKFCPNCGAGLIAERPPEKKFCPNCGAVAGGGKFCSKCGKALSGAPAVKPVSGSSGDPASAWARNKPIAPHAGTAPAADKPASKKPASKKPERGFGAFMRRHLAIVITVIVLAVAALIVGLVLGTRDRAPTRTIDADGKVKLGMTEAEIAATLSEFRSNEFDGGRIWYGGDYDLREHETFEALIVTFDAKGRADFVFHDFEHVFDPDIYSTATDTVRGESLDAEAFETIELAGGVAVITDLGGVEYRTLYTNGSSLEAYIPRGAVTFELGDGCATAKWRDAVSDHEMTLACRLAAAANGTRLSAYYGSSRAVILPSGITEIGANAFGSNEYVTRVTLPDTLTKIGSAAFSGCAALEEINFPKSLEAVDGNAFYGCAALDKIVYAADSWELYPALRNLSALEIEFCGDYTEIPSSAFYGCKSIKKATFPDGIEHIGSSAFYGCTALEEIEFIGTPETAGDYVFGNTAWLAAREAGLVFVGKALVACKAPCPDAVVVPEGVRYIPYGCFANLAEIRSVRLPSTLKAIGGHAFENCTGLAEVYITDGVTEIGDAAFAGCTALGDVRFGSGVTHIPERMFFGDRELANVCLGAGTRSIGKLAFGGCEKLQRLVLPLALDRVEADAFDGCDGLEAFFSEANELPQDVVNALTNANPAVELLYADDWDYMGDSVPTPIWIMNGSTLVRYEGTNSYPIVPNGITAIGENAFFGKSALVSVTLPDTVKTIGASAFAHCGSLEKINIPASLETIDESAFDGSTTLRTLVWAADKWDMAGGFAPLAALSAPDILFTGDFVAVPDDAFRGCENIRSVSFPASVTTLGNAVFSGCSELEEVEFEGRVTDARDDAFAGTKWLGAQRAGEVYIGDALIAFKSPGPNTAVFVRSGVKYIPSRCFYGTEISIMSLPDTVVEIGREAFAECGILHSVIMSRGLKTLGDGAFRDCTSLLNVMNFGYIGTVGEYAFSGCSSLMTMYLDIRATTLGAHCFDGCSGLDAIELAASVETIGECAFAGCAALETIYVDADAEAGLPSGFDADWLGDCTAQIVFGKKPSQEDE